MPENVKLNGISVVVYTAFYVMLMDLHYPGWEANKPLYKS